ncbi:unnamed protein product [Closterium sp. Naga37s-1]|nr:unnamed protein product [Closterium sp. Naga37s-1]
MLAFLISLSLPLLRRLSLPSRCRLWWVHERECGFLPDRALFSEAPLSQHCAPIGFLFSIALAPCALAPCALGPCALAPCALAPDARWRLARTGALRALAPNTLAPDARWRLAGAGA